MPRFVPSILIDDCFGSVGDITFFHRGSTCFYKKKPVCTFKGTEAQNRQKTVHQRALAAWRNIPQAEQAIWHQYGHDTLSHRPPFDGSTHISGYNLFVSAYHGFAALGNEHIPTPQPFCPFPVYHLTFVSASRAGRDLLLDFRLMMPPEVEPGRYQVLLKVQLTRPGYGREPGYLRNFLAESPCLGNQVRIVIPAYREIWGLDLDAYTAHTRHILLDRETGYRSQYIPLSFKFSLN